MTELPKHRIQVKDALTALVVRNLIEQKLGVRAWSECQILWAVYFHAPKDVDLDFLQPEILPPKESRGEEFTRRMLSS